MARGPRSRACERRIAARTRLEIGWRRSPRVGLAPSARLDSTPVSQRALRTLILCAGLVAALALGGCGNKQDFRLEASTEGPYIDFGPVKYQVQMSRELNPSDEEDRSYLAGLPEGTGTVKPDEVFFGVWMRAENTSDTPMKAASDFEIIDTQEKVYRPIPLDAKSNPFAYVAATIAPKDLIPTANTPPSDGPIQGSLLLFRLDLESYQNRPLELRFRSPQDAGQEATIDLDL